MNISNGWILSYVISWCQISIYVIMFLQNPSSSDSVRLLALLTLGEIGKHVWVIWTFLSPPVRMHSGLLCIAICLYVCLSVIWPKFRLENKSLDKKSYRRDMACLYVTWPKFRLEKKSLDKRSYRYATKHWNEVHGHLYTCISGHLKWATMHYPLSVSLSLDCIPMFYVQCLLKSIQQAGGLTSTSSCIFYLKADTYSDSLNVNVMFHYHVLTIQKYWVLLSLSILNSLCRGRVYFRGVQAYFHQGAYFPDHMSKLLLIFYTKCLMSFLDR